MSRADNGYGVKRVRVYVLLASGFSEVAKFSLLILISYIIKLIDSLLLHSRKIASLGWLTDFGNPILAFIALVTALYAVIVAYDAAQYFSEYDRHTYGVALTIVKIVIGGLGLALLAFILMIVSPLMGLAALFSFASMALIVIGALGLGYFIYLLGEIHDRGYPVPPRSLFTIAAITWIPGLFLSIFGVISTSLLFYASRKAAVSLGSKITR